MLKSARRLGIPTGICVASWDNLTNKGLLKFVPDRVFVWNEDQVREATDLHGIPKERVRATGAGLFDEWFERRPSRTAEQFAVTVGLDPSRPFVVVPLLVAADRAPGRGRVRHRLARGVARKWGRARPGARRSRPPSSVRSRQVAQSAISPELGAVVWPRAGAYTVAGRRSRRLLRHPGAQRRRRRDQHHGDDRGGRGRQERTHRPSSGVRARERRCTSAICSPRTAASCTSPTRSTSTSRSSARYWPPRTTSCGGASSSNSFDRTESTGRRRRSSQKRSRSWHGLEVAAGAARFVVAAAGARCRGGV